MYGMLCNCLMRFVVLGCSIVQKILIEIGRRGSTVQKIVIEN